MGRGARLWCWVTETECASALWTGLSAGCAQEYPDLVLGVLEKLYLEFLSSSPFAQMNI